MTYNPEQSKIDAENARYTEQSKTIEAETVEALRKDGVYDPNVPEDPDYQNPLERGLRARFREISEDR